MRKYIVKDIDQEGRPLIGSGELSEGYLFDDFDLVPMGYELELVENTAALKILHVTATRK